MISQPWLLVYSSLLLMIGTFIVLLTTVRLSQIVSSLLDIRRSMRFPESRPTQFNPEVANEIMGEMVKVVKGA